MQHGARCGPISWHGTAGPAIGAVRRSRQAKRHRSVTSSLELEADPMARITSGSSTSHAINAQAPTAIALVRIRTAPIAIELVRIRTAFF
jgi:hypothetical protein